MQDDDGEGGLYPDELPAIELEIDDDFTVDNASFGGRRYGRSGRCLGRRCLLVLGFMILGMAAVGGGLGVLKGRRSTRASSENSVENKAVSAGDGTSTSTTEVTEAADTSTGDSTGTESSSGESTSDNGADADADALPGGATSSDTDNLAVPPPFALATPAPVAPIVPTPAPHAFVTVTVGVTPRTTTEYPTSAPVARGVWISTGSPSVHRTSSAQVAQFVTVTPAPQAAPQVHFAPVAATTSRTIPLSEALPAEVETTTTTVVLKTSWPELVGSDANSAVWAIMAERGELNVMLLTSGVDPPPSGFDSQRVVVYRTSDGIVDRMPVVG